MRALKQVAVWHKVTEQVFREEVQPLHEPAILKGFVNNWPAVIASKSGDKDFFSYLSSVYAGGKVRYARLPASENGRFFYNADFSGFNFERQIADYDEFIEQLVLGSADVAAPCVAIQSAPLPDYFPEFLAQNPFTLFKEKLVARAWLGNRSVIGAHYDDAQNIACVVKGRRRFTLFPPAQVENLYVGPLEFTPAGAPVSMVDFANPDFSRFPRFKEALNHALVAELEEGDALYLPPLWWHHVQALAPINLLVNFWSGGAIAGDVKPVPADTLLMAMMTIRELPDNEKAAWRTLFDYYVFSAQTEKNDHIPTAIRGVRGDLTTAMVNSIKQWLVNQLAKKD